MTRNRKVEIEKLAMEIVQKYNITENPGANLQVIANGEGIELLAYPDWEDHICGRFLYVEETPTIFYNADHGKNRQAFTIAHELGHYFLKHLDDVEPEVVCLERDFEEMDDVSDEKAEREAEANFFAACLLLPFNLLQPVFDNFMEKIGSRKPLYVDNQPCNFLDYKKCIYTIQLYFLASELAIRYRLINLGWMDFNLEFRKEKHDFVSISKYIEKLFENSAKINPNN